MAEELFLLDFAMLSTRCQRLALRLLKTKRNASSERMTTADSPLAESTQAERVVQGYPANEPLLRTGELRDSIEHKLVSGDEAQVAQIATSLSIRN